MKNRICFFYEWKLLISSSGPLDFGRDTRDWDFGIIAVLKKQFQKHSLWHVWPWGCDRSHPIVLDVTLVWLDGHASSCCHGRWGIHRNSIRSLASISGGNGIRTRACHVSTDFFREYFWTAIMYTKIPSFSTRETKIQVWLRTYFRLSISPILT